MLQHSKKETTMNETDLIDMGRVLSHSTTTVSSHLYAYLTAYLYVEFLLKVIEKQKQNQTSTESLQGHRIKVELFQCCDNVINELFYVHFGKERKIPTFH